MDHEIQAWEQEQPGHPLPHTVTQFPQGASELQLQRMGGGEGRAGRHSWGSLRSSLSCPPQKAFFWDRSWLTPQVETDCFGGLKLGMGPACPLPLSLLSG